jgi:hypothetical protein
MVYGYEVQGRNDHKVNAAKEMAQLVSESALPGVLLVNDIPLREWSVPHGTHSPHNNMFVSTIYSRMVSVVKL